MTFSATLKCDFIRNPPSTIFSLCGNGMHSIQARLISMTTTTWSAMVLPPILAASIQIPAHQVSLKRKPSRTAIIRIPTPIQATVHPATTRIDLVVLSAIRRPLSDEPNHFCIPCRRTTAQFLFPKILIRPCTRPNSVASIVKQASVTMGKNAYLRIVGMNFVQCPIFEQKCVPVGRMVTVSTATTVCSFILTVRVIEGTARVVLQCETVPTAELQVPEWPETAINWYIRSFSVVVNCYCTSQLHSTQHQEEAILIIVHTFITFMDSLITHTCFVTAVFIQPMFFYFFCYTRI